MEFKNDVELDLTNEEVKHNLSQAFKRVSLEMGQKIPFVINGKKIYKDETKDSVNPADKKEVVGKLSLATQSDIDQAIKSCQQAFADWKFVSVSKRNEIAENLVKLIQQNRYELIAWIVTESGKNISEADGEISELVDFIHSYMIGADELKSGLDYLIPSSVEDREARYLPLGVGVAIAPWNFPASILGGMVMGPVLAGNAMLMKPSNDTGVVGYKLFELMESAGFPDGLINFVTGENEEIGDYVVSHPQIRFINFTGSMSVGLHINQLAAVTQLGQKWIKRVVTEMGGKNAIIVDSDADLDKAATGIVQSAFLMQGQKCSAGSRLIVLNSVYDKLIDKIKAKMKKLSNKPAYENGDIGPVIAQRAFDKIKSYIDYGKNDSQNNTLLEGGNYDESTGWFIEPTLFEVTEKSKIFHEEIFGPVLGALKVDTYEKALSLANDTIYGLTGAVYSNNESHIQEAIDKFYVGNLYFNRKTTGAVVYQHPFGGFNMSGTDCKTGTTNYVQQFLELQSVTRSYD
ncbi:aldehyde dehydrogenase family protein (plasmid) [Fructilactobacillus ixorae]|uniref:L-glutamate gamma-semialdehyde dehydrogenase n=1 Tax=Fructilactobacillus ixorae TaxID=1750535 RepID=A0ABY5C8W4_9LACO|nr:aldehyde dehydrogenase family protein [Fructilactobacillus ixorae]USS94023.1 aldehyde dehydrogenase family protein [Fructilactobacillus ixorae]